MYLPLFVWVLCLSLFCYVLLCVLSSIAIILKRKRELVLLLLLSLVWCMKFKKALNKEKNTPIIRKDENSLILKLIIASFNIRLLTLRKSVAS